MSLVVQEPSAREKVANIENAPEYLKWYRTVLAIIDKMDESVGELKLYFAGEVDSNQTPFEELSNNLRVAVMSTSLENAQLLLSLVRVIYDNSEVGVFEGAVEWFDDELEDGEVDDTPFEQKMERGLRCFADPAFITVAKLTDKVAKTTLIDEKGHHEITYPIELVNIWTLGRIRDKYLCLVSALEERA